MINVFHDNFSLHEGKKMRHNYKENDTYIHKKWSNNELLYTYIISTLKKISNRYEGNKLKRIFMSILCFCMCRKVRSLFFFIKNDCFFVVFC